MTVVMSKLVKVLLLIIGSFIIFAIIYLYVFNIQDNGVAKLVIIRHDILDDSLQTSEEINVKVNQTIDLSDYDGNNIKVLKINDKYVKIFRQAKRYVILNRTYFKSKEYLEDVIEKKIYEEVFGIDIDSNDPFGPMDYQSRYQYYAKFVK